MNYKSVFDIIGPIMIGPSSSHTAGAVRIGLVARKIFGEEPKEIEIIFYRSFAETYKGHATDVAIIGGLLNFNTDDSRIRSSLEIAKEKNISVTFNKSSDFCDHPNTVKILLKNENKSLQLTGISIGGGSISITNLDGFDLNFSGENPTMFVLHRDVYGSVFSITSILTEYEINISYMQTSRLNKGDKALMVIETDQIIEDEVISKISTQKNILNVVKFDNI